VLKQKLAGIGLALLVVVIGVCLYFAVTDIIEAFKVGTMK